MRVVMTVAGEGTSPSGVHELHGWLRDVPELRGRVGRDEAAPPVPGAMGPGADALVALLEPGGVAAAFAGALIAWVQTRRGSHTVTVVRPDGTEITISTRQARELTPEQLAELAERLARPPADPGDGG
ncbi:effector-associated constant component EACC1 [Streptomyces marincola]|uniref:effector-associated constant component EACC1 n=1 Tax=Streptomyces marincola TaxID=2878388 RepID=UPI001CF388B6|nr:hypothetical protein [Streptomyces marincola]UCM90471.1 hypothetical protein LC193_22445 [Streptomyces marincola]